jgi:hypothetical protein
MEAVPVRAWITLEVAKKLLADSGQDFDGLKKRATTKEFRPISIGAKANFDLKQAVRPFKSRNVVGKIDGSDPNLKDEWIIYTAHWDHLGRHAELKGDQIFNGALDNASGVATILGIARAHMKLPSATKRSRESDHLDRLKVLQLIALMRVAFEPRLFLAASKKGGSIWRTFCYNFRVIKLRMLASGRPVR